MNNSDLRRRVEVALQSFVSSRELSPPWSGRKVVIYGAGGFGRDLCKAVRQSQNVTVLGYIDKTGTGQTLSDGLPCHHIGSDAAHRWANENAIALIGVHNCGASLKDIKGLLVQAGFSRVVTPMEAYLSLWESLGWRYWVGKPVDYAPAFSLIEKARSLWADELSERLFLETILFRVSFDLEMLATPTGPKAQYADPSVPRWNESLRMVDGGAYTGDSIQTFLDSSYRIESVHAFEPDIENFNKLRAAAVKFPNATEISLWPCGIWSSTCRLNFNEGGGGGSNLSLQGSSSVPVVALDEALHNQDINLIKLDVEGAEPDALQGARRIIEKSRPGLAVCLYHQPQQLWSIPLWISALNLDYKFYYRVHEYNTFDTVLYAIPEAR